MRSLGLVSISGLEGRGSGANINPHAFASLNDIYRQLNISNQKDEVHQIVVRAAMEILRLDGCWLMLVSEDGSLENRCEHLSSDSNFQSHSSRLESMQAQLVYRRVLNHDQPMVISRKLNHLRLAESEMLGLNGAQVLCLVPLKAGQESLGLLVLGATLKGATDPFNEWNISLAAALGQQAANALYRLQIKREVEMYPGEVVKALRRVIEARDGEVGLHSDRLVRYSDLLARHLGCSEADVQQLRWAALLHDIGKIAIPPEILHRSGPLLPDEWCLVKKHPDIGAEIIASVTGLSGVAAIVRSHHENFDGTGYPRRLSGMEIPIGARVLAVVDSFIAMTEGRPYLPARPQAEALSELIRCISTKYDPVVVRAFFEILRG